MAVAKVILNGTTLIDTTDKTVTSSNLLQSYTALGADGNTVTGAFGLGNIIVNEQNLSSQTTIINSQTKVCETDSDYPGTILTMNQQSYCSFGDYLGSNIKIELNKTYHINGQLNIKWDNDNTEEYYTINTDFKLTNYSTIGISYTWEGSSGATQTFVSINIEIASQGIKTKIRPTRTGVITKTGVLLSGSYYEILQNDTDGYESVTLNLIDDPQYLNIYKSLACRSQIKASDVGVSKWCNSLSSIYSFQFAGQPLSGDFIFSNVTKVGQYAFTANYVNGFTGVLGPYNLTFPSLLSFSENAIFASNRGLISINCPILQSTGSYTFISCTSLSYLSFPSCTFIGANAFFNCPRLVSISFPLCEIIGQQAFQSCSNLLTVDFPLCTSINNYAFYNCSQLININISKCNIIASYAFASCKNLSTINFPSCTQISSYAFQNCTSLENINFPLCSIINNYAFNNCTKLVSVSFPSCTDIGLYAFSNCSSLNTVNFPLCENIGSSAFHNCLNLVNLNFPICININSSAFYSCNSLNNVNFSMCEYIGNSAFLSCKNLVIISFPKCTSIGAYAFYNCNKLESVYFMGSSIPSVGTTIFGNTPIHLSTYLGYYGSIYVPASLLASYKTATNWATYSNRMVGI